MVKSVSKLIATIAVAAVCLIPRLSAQEYVGGLLTDNTVFSPSQNPYIVIEPLIVPEDITLTIEPGTHVFFMVRTSLKIEGGTLIARGHAALPIMFDAQTDKKWDGVGFIVSKTLTDENGNYISGSILEYASINQTTTGLVMGDTAKLLCNNISITNGDYGVNLQSGSVLQIHNSTIDECSYGMYIKNSGSNVVDNCMISNCDFGIFFPSNNISRYNRIINNNLSYNTNIALFMSMGQSSLQYNIIRGNTVSYNNIGLHIGNGGTADIGHNLIESNVVQNNDIGIKLSQDADTLRANLIEMNVTGLLLSKASSNYLINNLIQNNEGWGITLTDGSDGNLISTNGLYNNSSGIKVTHKDFKYSIDNSFVFNSLYGNQNEAFLFEAGPQQPLVSNTITGSRDTAVFVNHFDDDILAAGNWWGTSDTTLIDSLIFDFHDSELYGEVIYKPVLDYPDPGSPISKPRNVVKRLIGTRIKVDWTNNTEADLAGYRVYYGNQAESGFIGFIDVGADTSYVFENLSLFDPIAVTAYDDDADGLSDQPEGHESAFSPALAGPYAGADTSVCHGAVYRAEYATSLGDQNLIWTTSGDGVFDDPGLLNTTYTPGASDNANGSVALMISISTSGFEISDEILVTISGEPFAFAGNDTTVNQHDAYNTHSAIADNYSTVSWTTFGDGVFTTPDAVHTQYQPGNADIIAGAVQLVLTLQSDCGNLKDTLLLVIIPSYSINGRIHRNGNPASDGLIVAIKAGAAGAKAVSTVTSMPDGSFQFLNLATGNYYLYALNDPSLNPGYLPTYYAESHFWQMAYLLPLDADVYDVDIELLKTDDQLPEGSGAISGFFNYLGKAGDDDSLYSKPWFAGSFFEVGGGNGLPAANHVVLLMNPDYSRIFRWTLTASDGSFYFNGLPYGNYRLWGEKAGYSNSISPLITLSPANDDVEGIQLTVNQKSIEITLPERVTSFDGIVLYPNPADDRIWLTPAITGALGPVEVKFYNSEGRLVLSNTTQSCFEAGDCHMDISALKAGLYIAVVSFSDNRKFSVRLAVTK
ncbi:MAG: right-handed parallel beta-helix repeat-containing protein [Bacteroidales bacterium]|nr:right-handed parallel beta-helix repeat-containing protein [Bacteroidales bacterium]